MGRSYSHLQAIFFAAAGFTAWVLSDVCIKLTAGSNIPAHEIAGFFCLTCLVFLFLKAKISGEMGRLRPKNASGQALCGVFSFLAFLTCVIALKHLPFTIFYICVFMAPIGVAILGSVFLREHLTLGKTIAVIVGFVGVVIAVNPFTVTRQGDWIGYTAVGLNVFFFATLMVLQRRMLKTETIESTTFMQALVSVVAFGIMTLFSHALPTLPDLFLLCCGGVFSTTGNIFTTTASKHTTAATVAQFHYTQIISGALFGYLIWHEMPNASMMLGSLIIIASGIYIANHMRKAARVSTIKPL